MLSALINSYQATLFSSPSEEIDLSQFKDQLLQNLLAALSKDSPAEQPQNKSKKRPRQSNEEEELKHVLDVLCSLPGASGESVFMETTSVTLNLLALHAGFKGGLNCRAFKSRLLGQLGSKGVTYTVLTMNVARFGLQHKKKLRPPNFISLDLIAWSRLCSLVPLRQVDSKVVDAVIPLSELVSSRLLRHFQDYCKQNSSNFSDLTPETRRGIVENWLNRQHISVLPWSSLVMSSSFWQAMFPTVSEYPYPDRTQLIPSTLLQKFYLCLNQ